MIECRGGGPACGTPLGYWNFALVRKMLRILKSDVAAPSLALPKLAWPDDTSRCRISMLYLYVVVISPRSPGLVCVPLGRPYGAGVCRVYGVCCERIP